MSRPVTSIPFVGPATKLHFDNAGITSAEEVIALGPDEAYRRLLQSGCPAHFIGYYVLVMGLQGRPWNDCKGKEKDELRVRFEAIRSEVRANPSEVAGRTRLDMVLNEIGLVAKR